MDECGLSPGVTGAVLVELTPAGVQGAVGRVRYRVRSVGPVGLDRVAQIVVLRTALELLIAVQESGGER